MRRVTCGSSTSTHAGPAQGSVVSVTCLAPWSERMRCLAILAVLMSSSCAASASDFTLDPARLGKSGVRYDAASKIVTFPVPAISARREGLSSGPSELDEIKDRVLYPLVERSPTAVSAIVLEWQVGRPEVLGVSVIWSDGQVRESLIPRAPQGHYDEKAYEVFFAKPTP